MGRLYYNGIGMRILGALWAGLQAFVRGLLRAIRQLFHEVTGALFAVFTVVGIVGAWREWKQGSQAWLVALPVLFTLMMGYFAVSSFLSARRVR
jgi:hypothetical protein